MRKLLFLMLLFPVVVSAADLSLEFGQCRFGVERDGMFYNADLPHQNYMTPRCGGLVYSDKWRDSRFGWSAGLITSGNIEGRGAVARVVDGSHETGLPCDTSTWLGCHATFDGEGKMYGVRLGLNYDHPLPWHMSLRAEGGMLFFRSVYRSTISPVDYTDKEIKGVQDSGWNSTPAPWVGVMWRYHDRLYIGARYYWPAGHRALSLTNHAITELTTGVVLGQW